jgi:hypothetical protein
LEFFRSVTKNSLVFLTLISSPAFCQQSASATTSFLDSAVAKAQQIYSNSVGSNAHLYNGVELKDYNIHNYDIGYPYFLSDDWIEGTVTYDGQHYKNVYLFYDLVRDKVLVEHIYGHFKLELINEKIADFSMNGHKFTRLVADTTMQMGVRTGFYDLLYDGGTKVYAKRRKEIQKSLNAKTEIIEFKERTQYFIYKAGNYYPVKSKSSVLKVFADRKSMLRKHLAKNKIRFAKNREYALVQAAKFFDESGN